MRSIGFDTKPLRHFDMSVTNAQSVYQIAERNPKVHALARIANSCRDLLRGSQIYTARETIARLLSQATEIEGQLTHKRKQKP